MGTNETETEMKFELDEVLPDGTIAIDEERYKYFLQCEELCQSLDFNPHLNEFLFEELLSHQKKHGWSIIDRVSLSGLVDSLMAAFTLQKTKEVVISASLDTATKALDEIIAKVDTYFRYGDDEWGARKRDLQQLIRRYYHATGKIPKREQTETSEVHLKNNLTRTEA